MNNADVLPQAPESAWVLLNISAAILILHSTLQKIMEGSDEAPLTRHGSVDDTPVGSSPMGRPTGTSPPWALRGTRPACRWAAGHHWWDGQAAGTGEKVRRTSESETGGTSVRV